ncbi:MAG: hypothetical protein WCO33_04415 [bacterium]
MTIYVFGNKDYEVDNIALRLLPILSVKLVDVEFQTLESLDELTEFPSPIYIMDSALGIRSVIVTDKIEALEKPKSLSLHDFDLSWNLKLLKKLGKINEVKIIAIPSSLDMYTAMNETEEVIKKILVLK